MSWMKLVGQAASITVHENGKITWNQDAHYALGSPNDVELFYDGEESRLGFREVFAEQHRLPVILDDDEYKIMANECLESVGLVPEDSYSASPNEPTPGTPETLGDAGIVWISIP